MSLRKTLIVSLALSIVTPSLSDGAQQPPKIPRIGILGISSTDDPLDEAYRQTLREVGSVVGQPISVEWRWAEGRAERLPALAADLVRLKVDAIMAFGDPSIRALQQATATIPLVVASDDLVGERLVASLARPGGNTTGFSILATELNVKRLELLKEVVPKVSRVAVLWDPETGRFHLGPLEVAARSLGLTLQVLEVRAPDDFAGAFEAAKKGHAAALNVLASPFLNAYRNRIVGLAAKNRLPAIYQWRESVEAGGLVSYGPTLLEMYRRLAVLLDKVLKGAKPADLPMEQPTRFELASNMKTAKALGLTLPQSILIRADQMIQ